MRRQEIQVLKNIQRIQKNQGLLLQKAKSPQQQLFQLFGQRYLVAQKLLHKHIDQVLKFLPGSFAHTALSTVYLSICLQMRIQLNPEEYPILKRLIEWTDSFPQLKSRSQQSFVASVLPEESLTCFNSYEEYLSFLNFIGADLIKLIKRSKGQKSDEPLTERSETGSFSNFDHDDLLAFLLNSLPKTLFNIILPNDVLPAQYKRSHQSLEILYKCASHEYFLKSKPYYAAVIRIMVKGLVKQELKPSQQRMMMEIVFRYFYAYHHDKKFAATDVFIEAYNSLSESTRFSMADEFILFFKIITKIGKSKFVQFLKEKSAWLKEICTKVSDKNLVGYAKEVLSPYPNIRISDNITISSGKTVSRTFQVFQEYSLFYFNIEVVSLDITIKLFYLGEITDSKPTRTLLLTHEKKSGSFRTNIMAAKQGLYQFEFDNTYSWLNSKEVKLEKIVLTPVEFQPEEDNQWTNSFFDNVYPNDMPDKSKVQPQKEEIKYQAQANITKLGSFFNMKINRGPNIYEFESDNEEKFVKKFNELLEKGGKIKWLVGGEPLEDTDNFAQLMSKSSKAHPKEEKKESAQPIKKEQIGTRYEEAPDAPEQKPAATKEQKNSTSQNSVKAEQPVAKVDQKQEQKKEPVDLDESVQKLSSD